MAKTSVDLSQMAALNPMRRRLGWRKVKGIDDGANGESFRIT